LPVKRYGFALSERDRIRVAFETVWGLMVDFTVRQESLFRGRSRPIVRYNHAHGSPHRDILVPDGTQQKEWLPAFSPAEAPTVAVEDIKAHFVEYRRALVETWTTCRRILTE